jgi:hypothetical protein
VRQYLSSAIYRPAPKTPNWRNDHRI